MSDICFSYVSPRPLQTLHWVCQMEQMTNLRRLAFSGQRRWGWLPSHFLRRKLFNETHTECLNLWKTTADKRGDCARCGVPLPTFLSRCKWGSTCSNASVTIKLLQIIVSCQRLWSHRFPKASCTIFKTSLMLVGIEFKTKKKADEILLSGDVCAGGCFLTVLALTNAFPNNLPTQIAASGHSGIMHQTNKALLSLLAEDH